MRKKAQLEMIGIAIVVVLVVLGFLFVLKAISKPPLSTHAGFMRAHITQDILNTMSISDADCTGLDMTELLKACAEDTNVNCGDPCIIFRDNLEKILRKTLQEQKLPYRLRAYRTQAPPRAEEDAFKGMFMVYEGCNETSIKGGVYAVKEKPGMLVIPTNAGDIKIMLEVCSRPY